jgi:hypothetical protein
MGTNKTRESFWRSQQSSQRDTPAASRGAVHTKVL